MAWGTEYYYLPVLVLIFLFVDLMIEAGSFLALTGNFFFWIYWAVYSVAAECALYILTTYPGSARLPKPMLVLIAIVATTTVVQSLTFKVGGKRVLDFSRYLDDYRRKVLSSTASLVTRFEEKRVLRECALILKKVNYVPGDPVSEIRMQQIYAEVMLFGARKPVTVQQEIDSIRQGCALTGALFGNEVARRVAQTDPVWVKNFLADAD